MLILLVVCMLRDMAHVLVFLFCLVLFFSWLITKKIKIGGAPSFLKGLVFLVSVNY